MSWIGDTVGGYLGLTPTSDSREYKNLSIYERVLDTGERTINLNNVATVTIVVESFFLWRILALVSGIVFVLIGLVPLFTGGSFGAANSLLSLLLAAGAFFLFWRWRDVSYLQIGASDGSRSVFRSTDQGLMVEVKDFLTKKINEQNVQATSHFHFGDRISGDKVSGDKVAGDKFEGDQVRGNKTVNTHNTHVEGVGHQVAAHSDRARFGNGATIDQSVHVDYSQMLPDVEKLHRFYANQPDAKHIEERLSELEFLLRSGTPTTDNKSRVVTLTSELSNILQAYPPMVQLFQHIGHLAGM